MLSHGTLGLKSLFLFALREEMDSLQKQMEEHTVTVNESMNSWTNAEEELAQLGFDNNTSNSPSAAKRVVENNNEAEQQQS